MAVGMKMGSGIFERLHRLCWRTREGRRGKGVELNGVGAHPYRRPARLAHELLFVSHLRFAKRTESFSLEKPGPLPLSFCSSPRIRQIADARQQRNAEARCRPFFDLAQHSLLLMLRHPVFFSILRCHIIGPGSPPSHCKVIAVVNPERFCPWLTPWPGFCPVACSQFPVGLLGQFRRRLAVSPETGHIVPHGAGVFLATIIRTRVGAMIMFVLIAEEGQGLLAEDTSTLASSSCDIP